MKEISPYNLRNVIPALIAVFFLTEACAQQSPKKVAQKTVSGVDISVQYFAPNVRGRVVWGDLVPYDEVWRTGANNATVFEVNKKVQIGGKVVPAGKYALFTIPVKGGPWTVILNKTYDQWGAYNYDKADDLLRFEVTPQRTIEMNEEMSFDIDDEGNVVFKWEYLSFKFPVKAS
jgi:hypothetical protein